MNESFYFQAGRLAFADEISPSACPLRSDTPEYKEWHAGWEFQQDEYFMENPGAWPATPIYTAE